MNASFFKQQTIKELFETSIESDDVLLNITNIDGSNIMSTDDEDKERQFEEVLAEVEEEDDVNATQQVKVEKGELQIL